MTERRSLTDAAQRWWMDLDRGWQAVLLGALIVTIVALGVPIP